MGKTPEYVKNATKRYREKFDFIQIRLPLGTKDRIIKEKGNITEYVSGLILDDLNKNN